MERHVIMLTAELGSKVVVFSYNETNRIEILITSFVEKGVEGLRNQINEQLNNKA